jgi:hypothetical protein
MRRDGTIGGTGVTADIVVFVSTKPPDDVVRAAAVTYQPAGQPSPRRSRDCPFTAPRAMRQDATIGGTGVTAGVVVFVSTKPPDDAVRAAAATYQPAGQPSPRRSRDCPSTAPRAMRQDATIGGTGVTADIVVFVSTKPPDDAVRAAAATYQPAGRRRRGRSRDCPSPAQRPMRQDATIGGTGVSVPVRPERTFPAAGMQFRKLSIPVVLP